MQTENAVVRHETVTECDKNTVIQIFALCVVSFVFKSLLFDLVCLPCKAVFRKRCSARSCGARNDVQGFCAHATCSNILHRLLIFDDCLGARTDPWLELWLVALIVIAHRSH
jgi:hypothetical protein